MTTGAVSVRANRALWADNVTDVRYGSDPNVMENKMLCGSLLSSHIISAT